MNTSAYHPQANDNIERYLKTMNQGLSHYVNASGTNWDTLVPFYVMAYKATLQGNGTIERYDKTMNQGLSHYVNASCTNWDTLVPFYLMAYRATPHGTSGYSPYYLLHGPEMILPTAQDLRAKLSPGVRESECANSLEILKSTLKTAYKSVRENNYKFHVTNEMYFD